MKEKLALRLVLGLAFVAGCSSSSSPGPDDAGAMGDGNSVADAEEGLDSSAEAASPADASVDAAVDGGSPADATVDAGLDGEGGDSSAQPDSGPDATVTEDGSFEDASFEDATLGEASSDAAVAGGPITASPASLTIVATCGSRGGAAGTNTITVTNESNAVVSWSAVASQGLTLGVLGSVLQPGASANLPVDVAIPSNEYPAGPTVDGSVTITAGSEAPITVDVTENFLGYFIQAPEVLAFGDTATSLQLSATITGTPPSGATGCGLDFGVNAQPPFSVSSTPGPGPWTVTYARTSSSAPVSETLDFVSVCGAAYFCSSPGVLVTANLAADASVGMSGGGPDAGSVDGSVGGGPLTGVASLSAGGNTTCAVTTAGAVLCWGYGENGQLGNAAATNASFPQHVTGLTSATAVAVGDDHACAIVSGGTVECWGQNVFGEMGNGTTTGPDNCSGQPCYTTPTPVSNLTNVTALAAGSSAFTCALRSDGTVWCWGYNSAGGIGNASAPANTVTPMQVCSTDVDAANPCSSYLTGATAISAGGGHACAVVAGGAVACWGLDSYGELGSNVPNGEASTPVLVPGIQGATSVAAGDATTCALLAGGTVACWGLDAQGETGNGATSTSAPPTLVSNLSGAIAVATSPDADTTCVLLGDSTVECWGYNSGGAVGNGSTTNALTPSLVWNLSDVTAISGSCAVLSTGTAECWGYNNDGQLGTGNTTGSYTPVVVE